MLSSEYIGDDPYGHPRFDNTRSDIGELVYQLKYQMNTNVLAEIVDALSQFINERGLASSADIILPVPPSKDRQFQPVLQIAEATAKANHIYYADDVLYRTSADQAKSMMVGQKSRIVDSIRLAKHAKRPCNILLIDDVYQTGSTLNECVRVLRTDNNIRDIFVVTMTKTAKGG